MHVARKPVAEAGDAVKNSRIRMAATGLRWRIIGKASAQDAQYAACDVRTAERTPAPPKAWGMELS